jgi:carboxyl-terminal processing protease
MQVQRKYIAGWAAAMVALVATAVADAPATIPTQRLAPDAQHGKTARVVARELPREHLTRHPLDDTISQRALDNFIRTLDYERIYFLADDIDRVKLKALVLDDELRRGEIQFAFDLFEVFKARVRDRVAFTDKLLERGFDTAIEETYAWKRKDAPWPATTAEWDELWRKRIKNEYLRRVVAKELGTDKTAAAGQDQDGTGATDGEAGAAKATTNKPPTSAAAPVPDGGADGPPPATDAKPAEKPVLPVNPALATPEGYIRDRYRQFLTTIEASDSGWVTERYLGAFTHAYDPHCDYMSPASEEDFDIEMKLSLVGIGALLRGEDGAAKIVELIPGGPAAQDKRDVRLLPGDKIVAVAQEGEEPVSILHWPLYKAVRLIRGQKGTRVFLTVIPAADLTGTQTRTVDLVRDEVNLEEREAKSKFHTHPRPDGEALKLGVIELPAFYADLKGKRLNPDYRSASRDVGRILREMQEAEVDGIVLDLRNNGGGSLLESVLMTGLFIQTGPVVQVREPHGVSILPDNDPAIAYSGPLVILVNRLSASASEILAAALQDYGRAIVVGDSKTHGKGSVQTILHLSRDSRMGALKVTNALFYRVSGGSTQLRGVQPDIVLPSAFDFMEIGEDHLPNALEWSQAPEVMYSPFAELSTIIPQLAAASAERRRNDERFLAYAKLLARVETMNNQAELSLKLDTRHQQARAERELSDAQNRLLEQSAGDNTDKDRQDLVLRETLSILADYIALDRKERARREAVVHSP